MNRFSQQSFNDTNVLVYNPNSVPDESDYCHFASRFGSKNISKNEILEIWCQYKLEDEVIKEELEIEHGMVTKLGIYDDVDPKSANTNETWPLLCKKGLGEFHQVRVTTFGDDSTKQLVCDCQTFNIDASCNHSKRFGLLLLQQYPDLKERKFVSPSASNFEQIRGREITMFLGAYETEAKVPAGINSAHDKFRIKAPAINPQHERSSNLGAYETEAKVPAGINLDHDKFKIKAPPINPQYESSSNLGAYKTEANVPAVINLDHDKFKIKAPTINPQYESSSNDAVEKKRTVDWDNSKSSNKKRPSGEDVMHRVGIDESISELQMTTQEAGNRIANHGQVLDHSHQSNSFPFVQTIHHNQVQAQQPHLLHLLSNRNPFRFQAPQDSQNVHPIHQYSARLPRQNQCVDDEQYSSYGQFQYNIPYITPSFGGHQHHQMSRPHQNSYGYRLPTIDHLQDTPEHVQQEEPPFPNISSDTRGNNQPM